MNTLDKIKEALEDIANPYGYFQRQAEEQDADILWAVVDEVLSKPNWFINKAKDILFTLPKCSGEFSDGYHTFDELYNHRMHLFAVICNQNKEVAWKSKLHSDGTMYDDYFIVGITTPEGDYTYHYHLSHWDKFNVKELEKAPEWDGHKPSDIIRLNSLISKEQ